MTHQCGRHMWLVPVRFRPEVQTNHPSWAASDSPSQNASFFGSTPRAQFTICDFGLNVSIAQNAKWDHQRYWQVDFGSKKSCSPSPAASLRLAVRQTICTKFSLFMIGQIVQRSNLLCAPGLVKLVPAVARLFCCSAWVLSKVLRRIK